MKLYMMNTIALGISLTNIEVSLRIILLLATHVNARASSDDFGWMNSSFDAITTFIGNRYEGRKEDEKGRK